MAATETKTKELREKRAQAIAAMGLVTRESDRFRVATPGLRNRQQSYEVWRDENAKVRCTCLEFEANITEDIAFRCEHILAVKYSLLSKQARETLLVPAAQSTETEKPASYQGYVSDVRTPPKRMPESPLAKSLADLITPKQIGLIRALCRKLNLGADEECRKFTLKCFSRDCAVDELSKRAASWFISHLNELKTKEK